jgi:hypothetical protein
MLSLHKTQKKIGQAILGDALADDVVISDGLKPAQRVAIYRHHFKSTLREALALTFPVTARLVGESFFNGMADAFTAEYPPSHPCLAEYGGDFSAFIATFEPASSLPYLSDVAMFEWLINEAAYMPEYEGRAFYSHYPLGRIWKTNQPDNRSEDFVNLDEGGGWFVVEKTSNEVAWKMLNLPENTFD